MSNIYKHFEFHVSKDYFPGFSVEQPIYVRVVYKNEGEVVTVEFMIAILHKICINDNLLAEIRQAAINNYKNQ